MPARNENCPTPARPYGFHAPKDIGSIVRSLDLLAEQCRTAGSAKEAADLIKSAADRLMDADDCHGPADSAELAALFVRRAVTGEEMFGPHKLWD